MSGMELFGFFGSALVAISLMMSNLRRLRWINMMGAIVFTIYGFLIDALPVFVLNGWIVLVNIYYLRLMYSSREKFHLISPLQGINDPVVRMFLDEYQADINKIFTHFNAEDMNDASVWLTYRDLKPSGIFIFKSTEDPTALMIELDYVSPAYRDMKNAQLIFKSHMGQLKDQGITHLKALGEQPVHQQYLQSLGFEETGTDYLYQLKIS